MTRTATSRICWAFLLTAVAGPGLARADDGLRRYALFAGANDGGHGRELLRYAVSDARQVARVLEQLGGVPPEQRRIVVDADVAKLRAAFGELSEEVRLARAANVRTELVVYYSGHSDEHGLLLGGQRVDYRELRALLTATAADVRVAILDSCASGAVTREKGGTHGLPFLGDAGTRVNGSAFLTSSAADEASQESDLLEASFFTHYLLSGLRGAADLTGDGRVTLNEAYRFAFDETLARTVRTKGGAQHPAFDIQLAGTGDLVMTDLRRPESRLAFPEAMSGRYFVRSSEERIVAEVRKEAGRAVELAIDPGTYRITRTDGDALREVELRIERGALATLDDAAFLPLVAEATARRGDRELKAIPFALDLVPIAPAEPQRLHVGLSLVGQRTTRLDGFALTLGGHHVEEDVNGLQFAAVAAVAGRDLRGFQLTPGVAWAGGSATGIQAGALATVSRGELKALQLSAGANVAERGGWGVQAGGVNLSRGTFRGLQLAPTLNLSKETLGAQLGGVNVSGDVAGLQLGLVNVGRHVRGVQLGLVNISDEHDGVPLGLVNLVTHGRHQVELFTTDRLDTGIGLRFGARHASTLLAVSFDPRDPSRWGAAAGLGLSAGSGSFWVDFDALAWSRQPDRLVAGGTRVGATTRALATYKPLDWLSIFAGPALHADVGLQLATGCCDLSSGLTVLGPPRLSAGLLAGLRFGSDGSRPTPAPGAGLSAPTGVD